MKTLKNGLMDTSNAGFEGWDYVHFLNPKLTFAKTTYIPCCQDGWRKLI